MQYNEPYGGTAGAPYVNGDPSIGRAGSIPPAAAIEFPQREIVAIIEAAGITPFNDDLQQLGKAIQSGKLFYGADIGTANHIVTTLNPVPPGYVAGMVVLVKIASKNSAAVDIDCNSLGVKSVTYEDGSALLGNDFPVGAMVQLRYDGSKFQCGLTRTAVLNVRRSQVVADRGASTQAIPDSVSTRVTNYGTVAVQSVGGTTFSSGLMTVGADDAGLWFVSFHCRQTILSPSGFTNAIHVNNSATAVMTDGANVPTGGATAHGAGARLLNLAAGNTVEMRLLQTSGSSITFNDLYDITAVRLGAS